MYGTIDGERILLTGDAGQKALERTANFCDAIGLPLQQFKMVSIPHHGSRRNVGPTILSRLVGNKVPEGSETHFSAIVSAAKDDADHPRRVVMNAFKRRGARTSKTEGQVINTRHNVDMRPGFTPTAEIPLYGTVEE
jgi:beta-lactamase superfamily II metal-dependent hydrolase